MASEKTEKGSDDLLGVENVVEERKRIDVEIAKKVDEDRKVLEQKEGIKG